MSLSSKEAAESLSDVERASRRSAQAFGYRKASPHFFLWGVVWLLGYGGDDLFPASSGYIWIALLIVAAIASFFIVRCADDRGRSKNRMMIGLRIATLIAISYCFIIATYLIFWPVRGIQQAAFIPLLVGAVYAGMGLWLGVRFVIAGALLAGIALGGYFYLHEHFMLWMAFAGSGALILAGFWLRTV
jgi:hypothetical protein